MSTMFCLTQQSEYQAGYVGSDWCTVCYCIVVWWENTNDDTTLLCYKTGPFTVYQWLDLLEIKYLTDLKSSTKLRKMLSQGKGSKKWWDFRPTSKLSTVGLGEVGWDLKKFCEIVIGCFIRLNGLSVAGWSLLRGWLRLVEVSWGW